MKLKRTRAAINFYSIQINSLYILQSEMDLRTFKYLNNQFKSIWMSFRFTKIYVDEQIGFSV